MATIDPSKSTSLLQKAKAKYQNSNFVQQGKISKEESTKLIEQSRRKDFNDITLKDYHKQKKAETQAIRAEQKAARQKAKQEKDLRKTNSDIAAELISNNTPQDQKPEGPSKFGPILNSQTKKIIGIITPNVLALEKLN